MLNIYLGEKKEKKDIKSTHLHCGKVLQVKKDSVKLVQVGLTVQLRMQAEHRLDCCSGVRTQVSAHLQTIKIQNHRLNREQ